MTLPAIVTKIRFFPFALSALRTPILRSESLSKGRSWFEADRSAVHGPRSPRRMKMGKLRHITLYPPPSNSLSKSLVDPLGEGGHVFPSPLMGEGQGEGEGVDSFSVFS